MVLVAVVLAVTVGGSATSSAHVPHPRSEAVAVRDYHRQREWRFKVIDRFQIDRDTFGDRPGRGRRYLVVRVRANRLAAGEGQPYDDANYDLLGGRSRQLYSGANDCYAPDDMTYENSVYRGGTVTGNICFIVRDSDARFKLRISEDYHGIWHRTR